MRAGDKDRTRIPPGRRDRSRARSRDSKPEHERCPLHMLAGPPRSRARRGNPSRSACCARYETARKPGPVSNDRSSSAKLPFGLCLDQHLRPDARHSARRAGRGADCRKNRSSGATAPVPPCALKSGFRLLVRRRRRRAGGGVLPRRGRRARRAIPPCARPAAAGG